MNKRIVLGVLVSLGLGVIVLLSLGRSSGLGGAVRVAVLDSGYSGERSLTGFNALDSSQGFSDSSGHGTRMVETVYRYCGGCEVLVIKITEDGRGLEQGVLARAIRQAVKMGARVINISAGLKTSEATEELRTAVSSAFADDVLILAAAGVGVPNPFRPVPLLGLVPQNLPEVAVVGAAKKNMRADPMLNFGDELDFSVVILKGETEHYGSSFATAKATGLAAQLLQEEKMGAAELRFAMRASSKKAASPDPHRIGFGFLIEGELEAHPGPVSAHLWKAEGLPGRVEINAIEELEELNARLDCPTMSSEKMDVAILKKGRGTVMIPAPASPECKVTMDLRSGNKTAKLEMDLDGALAD